MTHIIMHDFDELDNIGMALCETEKFDFFAAVDVAGHYLDGVPKFRFATFAHSTNAVAPVAQHRNVKVN